MCVTISPMSVKACACAKANRRPGSKQALVLELLQRDSGASLDDLTAATGWLPHTTRAVLTGLRKKGHRIERRKGQDSRSTYQITEPTATDAPATADGEA